MVFSIAFLVNSPAILAADEVDFHNMVDPTNEDAKTSPVPWDT